MTTPSFATPPAYTLRVQHRTRVQVFNIWGLRARREDNNNQWLVSAQVVYPDISTDPAVVSWLPVVRFRCEKTANQFLLRYGGDLGTSGNATIYHEEWDRIDQENMEEAQKELLQEATQGLLDNRRQSQVTRHLDMSEGAEDAPEPVPEEIPEEVQFILDGLTSNDEQTRREASLVVSAAVLASQDILSTEEMAEVAEAAMVGEAEDPASDYWGQFEREGAEPEPAPESPLERAEAERQAARVQHTAELLARVRTSPPEESQAAGVRRTAAEAFGGQRPEAQPESPAAVSTLHSPSHADAPLYGNNNNPPPSWELDDLYRWRTLELQQVVRDAAHQRPTVALRDLQEVLAQFILAAGAEDWDCTLDMFHSWVESNGTEGTSGSMELLYPVLAQLWPHMDDPRVCALDAETGAWYGWLQRFLSPGVRVIVRTMELEDGDEVRDRVLRIVLERLLDYADEHGVDFSNIPLRLLLRDVLNSDGSVIVPGLATFLNSYCLRSVADENAALYGIDNAWVRDQPVSSQQFHNVLVPFIRGFLQWQLGAHSALVNLSPYIAHLHRHSNYRLDENSHAPLLTVENKEEWYQEFEVATREIVEIPEPRITNGRVRYIQAYRRMVRNILDELFTPDS